MANLHPTPKKSRRLLWAGLTALLIGVLYVAGWLYLASIAKERVIHELALQENSGRQSTKCQSVSARGFPLSLYVTCSDFSFEGHDQTLAVAANAVNIGASVFSPRTIQALATSPATIHIAGLVPLQADWSKLKASARLNGNATQDISLSTDNLRLQQAGIAEPAITDPGLELLDLKIDLNSIVEPLKLKMAFNDLRLTGETHLPALPELDGLIDISSPASLAAFSQPDENGSILRNKSLQLNQMLFLLPSGASFSISGPASVDETGLINADLKIRLTNPTAIGSALETAFPDQAKNISTVIFALGSMPKDETGATIVPVVVRNGKASAGFIPLGRLPLL